jgi:hypothetical protein
VRPLFLFTDREQGRAGGEARNLAAWGSTAVREGRRSIVGLGALEGCVGKGRGGWWPSSHARRWPRAEDGGGVRSRSTPGGRDDVGSIPITRCTHRCLQLGPRWLEVAWPHASERPWCSQRVGGGPRAVAAGCPRRGGVAHDGENTVVHGRDGGGSKDE